MPATLEEQAASTTLKIPIATLEERRFMQSHHYSKSFSHSRANVHPMDSSSFPMLYLGPALVFSGDTFSYAQRIRSCNHQRMRLLLLSLFLLSVSGCPGTKTSESSTPTGSSKGHDDRDYVGKDAHVKLEELRFTSDDEKRRFLSAQTCFSKRAAAWEHFPLRKIGNFVQEDWCRGQGAARGCYGGGFNERAGVEWASVETLHYPQQWPQVFGILISGAHNQLAGSKDWSVSFSVHSNGKSIVGEGAHIDFRRGDDWVHVGTSYGWTIQDNRFTRQAEGGDPWTVFERLRSSSQIIRDEGVKHWLALETEVVEALEKNAVVKCVYGPYNGDGIPPMCINRVPLDAAEQATELAKIRKTAQRNKQLLEQEHVAMHAALMELASKDCF